ncbi:WG repeat-containing protein [Leptospira weilii]|uniref:WG repeat-containing protein n=1 Tax=Leptospira weilii TaxID=28184 RepID=UPI000774DD85
MKEQPLYRARWWSNDRKNCKLGYINISGQWAIEPEYDNADEFYDGLAQVTREGKTFLINERNEKIFEVPAAMYLRQFNEGLAVVSSDGKYGYMNQVGELVVPLQYEMATMFHAGRGSVQSSETKKWGAVDQSGKLVIQCKFLDPLYFHNQIAIAHENFDSVGFIRINGEYIITPKLESIGRFSSEGLARATDKKTRKYGFINLKGEYAIDPTIKYANEFSDGLAAIHDERSKWGYIDTSGKIVIPTKFNSGGDFSEGFADVLTSKWGYIDPTGAWTIQPSFTRANRFSHGVAIVEIKKKYGLIHTTGEYVLEPIYDYIDFNPLPGLIKVSYRPDSKTHSYDQFFSRDGKLVWSEFETAQASKPPNSRLENNLKKNDITIPEVLLADLKKRTQQIVSEFEQGSEPAQKAVKELSRISWEEVFTETVRQLDLYWQEFTAETEEELSGVLFFWDDTQGDTGLSACFATDNNDPEDLLNEFEGGEPAVNFDFVFSKVVPIEVCEESDDIHLRVRNDLLDVLFEKALAFSLQRKAFMMIRKTNPLYIFRSYAHDDHPPVLLFKVGKGEPKVLDAKEFIKHRILKDHPYFSQIFGQKEWVESYKNTFNTLSQDDLAKTLNLFLFTYFKQKSKPEYIKAIAERLPRSLETVNSNRLALSLAGYFALAQEPELALDHLRRLEKTEHLKTHFLWARDYLVSLEENPEFRKIAQWIVS